jgi:hypothetical protein
LRTTDFEYEGFGMECERQMDAFGALGKLEGRHTLLFEE